MRVPVWGVSTWWGEGVLPGVQGLHWWCQWAGLALLEMVWAWQVEAAPRFGGTCGRQRGRFWHVGDRRSAGQSDVREETARA